MGRGGTCKIRQWDSESRDNDSRDMRLDGMRRFKTHDSDSFRDSSRSIFSRILSFSFAFPFSASNTMIRDVDGGRSYLLSVQCPKIR
jgi:hypothetical protein